MDGIEEEIRKKESKFYQSIWLISVIAIGVAAGNLISHSISSWNDERVLKLALQKAEVKSNADLAKMDAEFKKLIYQLQTEAAKNQINKKDVLEQQVKDADCDYWIAQSKIEKTSESMAERVKACKAAGRAGY